MAKSSSGLDDMQQTVESRTTKQATVLLTILLIIWLCIQLKVLLVDVVIAVTLASAISPLANILERYKVPRFLTVLLTYIGVGAAYAGMGYLLWGPIKEQFVLMRQNAPLILDKATHWYDQQMSGLGIDFQISQTDFTNAGQYILNRTVDMGQGVLGVLLNAILVLFLAAYFVVNSTQLWNGIVQWLPQPHRDRLKGLIGPLGNRMGGYVRGQLLVSTAIAAFFAIGLSLIGVHYALVLGLLAGVMNLVPFVGSLVTTILAVIIAYNQSPQLAAMTLVLFVVEQAVESNFIVPFLLGNQVELDPLIVLFAILIGATLGGAVGALIAVPIASALLLLGRELYLKPLHEEEKALS